MGEKVLIAGAVGTAVLFGTFSSGIPGLPAADAQVAKAASQLPNGIGGRVYLNSTGAVFTAKINLPDTVKYDTVSTPYIYSGFRATSGTEADIGLQYSKQYNVWKPLMKVGSKNEETYIEGKDKFTYNKGFRPGSTVQMTIYKNLSGNTRMTLWERTMTATPDGLSQKFKEPTSARFQNGKPLLPRLFRMKASVMRSKQPFRHLLTTSQSTIKPSLLW